MQLSANWAFCALFYALCTAEFPRNFRGNSAGLLAHLHFRAKQNRRTVVLRFCFGGDEGKSNCRHRASAVYCGNSAILGPYTQFPALLHRRIPKGFSRTTSQRKEKSDIRLDVRFSLVEMRGIEPLTS